MEPKSLGALALAVVAAGALFALGRFSSQPADPPQQLVDASVAASPNAAATRPQALPTSPPPPTAVPPTPVPTPIPPTLTPPPSSYTVYSQRIGPINPHQFYLPGTAGQTMEGYWTVSGGGVPDIIWRVYSPSGGILDDSGRKEARYDFSYRLPATGQYLVEFDNTYSRVTSKNIVLYYRIY